MAENDIKRIQELEASVSSLTQTLGRLICWMAQSANSLQDLEREVTRLRQAEKTGAICPQCGFETVTSKGYGQY